MFIYIFTFVLAAGLSLYLTPIMREAALRFGIVDKPDGKLKLHSEPVAYLGGLGIALSFLLTLAFTFDFDKEVLGILLAGTIMLILGLVDDFGFLTPWVKLLGQLVAVLVLIKSGIYIKLTLLPNLEEIPIFSSLIHKWSFLEYIGDKPVLAYLLSAFWIVGITNAFNILDIMDGLSGSVAFVASLCFFAVAFINEKVLIATLTIALAGSILGFLKYNFQPAKIYLGDTGALFLGFMLATLGMVGSYTEKSTLGAFAPVIILGIPFFETSLVTIARRMKGQRAMFGSPDHYALRLSSAGMGVKTIVILSAAATLALGLASWLLISVKFKTAAIILAGFVVLWTVATVLMLKTGKVAQDLSEPPFGNEGSEPE